MMKTKQGYVMSRRVKARIVELMAPGNVLVKDVAATLGLHVRTVSDYLTDELRAEIQEASRKYHGESTVDDVDKAMMAQACAGNVQAARLVYMRMAQKGQMERLPTLEEIEAELQELKGHGRKAEKAGGSG